MSNNTQDPFDLSGLGADLNNQASSQPSSIPHLNVNSSLQSPSRIPRYVANGPMSYHNSPARSVARPVGDATYGNPNAGYSGNYPLSHPTYQVQASPSHPYLNLHQQIYMPSFRIVPQSVQIQHQNHMLTHISNTQKASPNSDRTTPLASGCNTPNSSHRPGLSSGCIQSASLFGKSPPHSSIQTPNSAKGFRYDDYMPLCEIQSALKKGQVLEGILRINPKNYEDAYISTPGEEMDIYVVGTNNRNRAFNGDLVAVKLNSPKKWKIRYEILKDNWKVWQTLFHETLKTEQVEIQVEPGESRKKKKRTRLRKKKNSSSSPSFESNNDQGDLPNENIQVLNDDEVTNNLATEEETKCVSDEVQDETPCDDVDTAVSNAQSDKKETKRLKEKKRLEKKEKRAQKRKEKKELRAQESSKCALDLSAKSPTSEDVAVEFQMATSSKCDSVCLKNDQSNPACESLLKDTDDTCKAKTTGQSDLINGLPRELFQLTTSELSKLPFGKWCIQKTGKVVGIVEKNHSRICGGLISFDSGLRSYAKLVPIDSRLPRILIPYTDCPSEVISRPSLYTSTLFLAEITDWPCESQMPIGKVLNQLGQMGEIETETKILLTENDVIDEPFPDEVEAQLSQLLNNWVISEKERNYRRDFTEECIFTIDPLTARDLDDALSIAPVDREDASRDSPQLFDVGVHIADVSFFIPENSLLDKEAQRRSTSFYLVHKVIHMLPRIIAEKACSLTPGEEKFTFSVVWRMDETGKIYETWFGRSIIRSSVKLAYEHALQMIEKPEIVHEENDLPQLYTDKWSMEDICTKVNQLHKIASSLRRARFHNGALEINKTKFSFALDSSTGLPTGFKTQMTSVANSLVEEFMLLANISVAKKIYESFPQLSLLRCHPPPDPKLLRDLNSFCSNYGIKLDSSTSRSLQRSLTPMKNNSDTTYRVVSHFLLRAMQQASYFCSGEITDPTKFQHFALNEMFYTHFTSPIRRYPDILVHRLLAASLGYTDVTSLSHGQMQRIASHCNKRKTASRLVSEGSQKFFLLLFMKSMPLIETAVALNVLDRSFDAIILTLDLKCRVYMDQLDAGAKYKYDSKTAKKSLTIYWPGESKPQVVSATSEVKLLVTVTDDLPLKFKAFLLRPQD